MRYTKEQIKAIEHYVIVHSLEEIENLQNILRLGNDKVKKMIRKTI